MRITFLLAGVVILLATEVNATTGFESEGVAFYQNGDVVSARVANRNQLAEYSKKLEEVCARFFASETTPESFDVVVALKPGQQSRVWFVSSRNAGEDKGRDSLRKQLEAVTPCDIKSGPLAFAIRGKIAGGDGKAKADDELPMPEEWRKADAKSERPLIIPDSILPIVWPDKK
ncbi:MAG: hypothetical protein ABI925_05325 [Verrucomicrobiota bacterium]